MPDAPGPRHSVSVAAAIFDDTEENVLLIKRRDNGRWEPPGGILEFDETVEEGLRREVREEAGVDIEVGQLTGVYKNMQYGILALVFKCLATSPPVISSGEAELVEWVPLDEMDAKMQVVYAVRVRDAVRPTTPTVRAHDGMHFLSQE